MAPSERKDFGYEEYFGAKILMCGILGWISPSLTDPKKGIQQTKLALEALRPRGPDASGVQGGKDWFLGHTRLAILDLSEKAYQPMTDGSGAWLVYNGEIYNFKELREELRTKGYRFQSSGDTEVLLYAMREWGVSCLDRLRGMFAFGWLDANRRELILCRDRYGVKPLAYEIKGNDFRFASDLHALRLLPGASRQIDSESAYLYMGLGYVPSPYSILQNVKKLKPGCYLHVNWSNEGILRIEEHAYWSMSQIPVNGNSHDRDEEATLHEFEKGLKESIRYRLISDVPVGVLLSGGIDSTLVTALCREEANGRVPTFTMGFEDPKCNEAPYATAIAGELGGQHQEFYIRAKDVLGIWEKLWEIYDEPFADSSALPMVALCHLVAPHIKVALTGDGGDEIFAGYPWHRALDRLHHFPIPGFFRSAMQKLTFHLSPVFDYRLSLLNQPSRIAQWSVLRTGLTDSTATFLPVEGATERPPFTHYFQEWSKEIDSIEDPVEWASRMDLLTYLPDDLMVKSDRAGMSVSLELREPLLDHQLTTWCLGLPVKSRYDRRTKKGKVFPRRVLKQRVHPQLLHRPKQGFIPPLHEWLEGPLQKDAQNAIEQLERGDLSRLELPVGFRNWHQCAQKLNDPYQQFLWRIICFSKWLNRHRSLCSAASF